MNINHLKGILGDAVSNEVRTLELRVGQVVRGVVLQQHPNNEATVSINGVQVRAKLELPIMEGQASLLQVQPDSKGGQVHLKQVDPITLGLQDPMKDILKALSLPDKSWANELIKDLRKEGFALNKETAAAFQRAASLMPAGVNQEQWMQAAATLFKRGLPLTEASIAAIHQLQSGTPSHSLIQQLQGQLQGLLQQSAPTQSHSLLLQLTSLLDSGSALVKQLTAQAAPQSGQGQGNATNQQGINQASASQVQTQGGNQQGAAPATQANAAGQSIAFSSVLEGTMQQTAQQAQQGAGTQGQANASTIASNVSGNQILPQLMKLIGLNYEAVLGKQIMQQPSGVLIASQPSSGHQNQVMPTMPGHQSTTGVQSTNVALSSQGAEAQSAALQTTGNHAASTAATSLQQGQGNAANGTNQPPTAQAQAQQNMITASTQSSQQVQAPSQQAPMANIQHSAVQSLNSDAAGTMSSQTPAQAAQAASAGQQELTLQPQAQAQIQASTGLNAQDNMKAAILQLMQASDVPGQVKETAQQLLQAITGQQLMLTAERNQSVFSHVTMYIPIRNEENGQTAAVHIQTRRDRKGELDAENCRIVFDLNMNALGPTLVDMNILNKIISLNIWNDHPAVASIIEGLKPEISESLYNNGYMLSSLRATPIPLKEDQDKVEEGKPVIIPPDIDQLNSKRYKGVDFKI